MNSSIGHVSRYTRGALRLAAAILLTLGYVGALRAAHTPAAFEIPGSGPPEALTRHLADAFNAQRGAKHIIVTPSVGAATAIEALLSGKVALARLARPLSNTEKKRGLREIAFAREAIVFTTGKGVTLDGLTTGEFAALFSGVIADWSHVRGPRAPVRVVYREDTEMLLQGIRRALPAFATLRFSTDGKLVNRDYEMLDLIGRYRYSLGWGSLANVRSAGLNSLKLDGIAATTTSLGEARYPLTYEAMLTYQHDLAGLAGDFVTFVFSPAGRKVIEGAGALSLPRG